jgi:hypothetical protein
MSDSEDAVQRGVTKSSRTKPLYLAVVIMLAIIGFVHISQATSATSSNSKPTGPPYAFSYTCCAASVVNTVYHPGQTIVIHWSSSRYSLDGSRAATITLSMGLSGPFRTVASLKHDSIGAHPQLGRTTANAAPIHLRNNVPESPVSRIQIPKDAAPGYYNMTMKTGNKVLWESGASVIRIASAKQ